MKTVIAIDGPAASGKSSVAREVARRLHFVYVNSGSFYRAITWQMIHEGVNAHSAENIAQAISRISIDASLQDYEARCLINGKDLESRLRDSTVNENVSVISRVPAVREALLPLFHELAEDFSIVMEGRDIGSVVFPGTPHKFYLDASPEVRRQRRVLQGQADEIAARDRIDATRVAAPLVIAEDALVLDSTNLTVDGVVGEIVGRLKLYGLEIPAE